MVEELSDAEWRGVPDRALRRGLPSVSVDDPAPEGVTS